MKTYVGFKMKDAILSDEEVEIMKLNLVAEYNEMMNCIIQRIKKDGSAVTSTKMKRARKSIAFMLLNHVTKFNLYPRN